MTAPEAGGGTPAGGTADADVGRQRARALSWSGRALSRPLSPPEVVTIGLDAAAALSRTGSAAVACAAAGDPARGRADAPVFASAGVDVTDAAFEGGVDESAAAAVRRAFGNDCVQVPVVWDDRVLGFIAVGLADGESEGQLPGLATVLAEQVALALRLAAVEGAAHRATAAAGVPTVEADGRLVGNVGDAGGRLRVLGPGAGSDGPVDAETQTLLSSVAHDLRSPLAMVRMCADMLGEMAGAGGEELARQVRMACRHQDAMIRNLIDFKMLETQGRTVRVEPIDPLPTIREAVSLCEPAGGDGRVAVETATDFWVLADADILRQVLVNLLSNALKFTPDGGEVVVRVREEPSGTDAAPRRTVAVEVRDGGVGIEPDALPKIFTPYYRTKSGGEFRGLGLGLAISHVLTDKLGGFLRAQSEVGVGSVFSVLLPATPPRT